MKSFIIISFLFLLFLSSHQSFAQENNQDAMMQAWQEYMTPGSMHTMLAKGVGEWKSVVTMWMDPGQPPTTTEGTSVCEAIMGGRYFQYMHTSTMMGMPFSGMEISGYDNVKKKFFSSWIDNMGTGLMYLEGTYDEAAKTITYTGNSVDPMGNDMKIRETVKYIDDDTVFFEMFMEQGGKEMKSMEITSTRKK